MLNYLSKIKDIKFTNGSSAELSEFVFSARLFITEMPKSNHKILVDGFNKVLNTSNDADLLKLVYKIIPFCNFTEKDIVNKTLIEKHYENENIKQSMILYINKIYTLNKTTFADLLLKVKKDVVEDPDFISKDLFVLIKQNPIICRDFLRKHDINLIIKQLEIILNTNVSFNINYFSTFLGNKIKFIAFKSFEVCSKMKSLGFEIKLKNLKIESVRNFLTFGFNFVEQSDQLVFYYKNGKIEELINLLKKIDPSLISDEKDFIGIKMCFYNHQTEQIDTNNFIIGDFNYFFEESSFRQITDCAEW
ncbi:hypothetical protein NUSPORA_01729 [Nucleospora cyclopteri]